MGEKMKKLPYRAVIVDFDRTLLHTDKAISGYTAGVLRKWQEAGACLFAATARPERAITEYCGIIAFDAVTTLNGARTVTPGAVFEYPIACDEAESVLEQLHGVPGAFISVETDNGIYSNRDFPLWQPAVMEDLRGLPGERRIYKVLASHPEIPADGIPVVLPDNTYSTVADRKLLQVMSRSATKWNGVRKMLEAYGIDPAQAVYFGDDNDDIEPIRNCGCGVAVSNALDCVKGIADYITGSNDGDGVAAFLAERLADGCQLRILFPQESGQAIPEGTKGREPG